MSKAESTEAKAALRAAEIALARDDYETAEQATVRALGQIRKCLGDRDG